MSTQLIVPETDLSVVPAASDKLAISPERLALAAFRSGMFKKLPNVDAALMLLQFGTDLNLSATTALTSIHFIEGKPTMSGNLLWSLVLRDPEYNRSYVKPSPTDKSVTLIFHRRIEGETVFKVEHSFTIEEAKQAGLLDKPGGNWKKYPKAMLFNRAVSSGIKMYAAHLTMGYTVYTPDELGAEINAEGELADFSVSTSPGKSNFAQLQELLVKHGQQPEWVMTLLGLEDPKDLETVTNDELERIKKALEVLK